MNKGQVFALITNLRDNFNFKDGGGGGGGGGEGGDGVDSCSGLTTGKLHTPGFKDIFNGVFGQPVKSDSVLSTLLKQRSYELKAV